MTYESATPVTVDIELKNGEHAIQTLLLYSDAPLIMDKDFVKSAKNITISKAIRKI